MESFQRFTEMEDKIEQLENELKWAIVVEMEAVSNVTIFLYCYHCIPICWTCHRFSPQLRLTLIKREKESLGTKEEQKLHRYTNLVFAFLYCIYAIVGCHELSQTGGERYQQGTH